MTRVQLPSNLTSRKSFIYRFPVQFPCNPFICRFYAFRPGWEGRWVRIPLRHCLSVSSNSFASFCLPPLTPLFAAKRTLVPFIFNSLQTLFCNTGGWGYASCRRPSLSQATRCNRWSALDQSGKLAKVQTTANQEVIT